MGVVVRRYISICKRVSGDTTLLRYIGLLKKEEEKEKERRRMPNCDFLLHAVHT